MNPPGKLWWYVKEAVLDFLFPPRCVGCGRLGSWLCQQCLAEVEFIRPPFCSLCGRPIAYEGLCPPCRQNPPPMQGLRSVAIYDGALREAIHQLKYKGVKALANPLGKVMGDYLRENPIPAEVLVPVPLHPDRLRQRGFNQALLLAEEVEESMGVPIAGGSLVKVKATPPQVGRTAKERRDNVRGAFRCIDKALEGKKVLLVDDVCASGATMEECSQELRRIGAASIWGLTLARGRWQF